MTTIAGLFVFSFILAVVMTRIVISLGHRLGVVDAPDHYRKVHLTAIPRIGGIAIFIAFVVPLALLYMTELTQVSRQLTFYQRELTGLLCGGAIALVLGVIDDVRDLSTLPKVILQVLSASVAYSFGLSIEAIAVPFGSAVNFGLLSFPVTIFWFLLCMNAVNLMDGLDGLAAGVCLFVGVTLFMVSLQREHIVGMLLMGTLSGAILGFLLFNFHPARIFLGDSGSMLLGFMVAALSLMSSRKAEAAIALMVPLIALGLPIFDTGLAILRRWARRLPIDAPDRKHIHHVLVSMGLSHRKTVLILYSACIALGISALLLTMERSEVTLLVIGALTIIAFLCIRIFGGLKFVDLLGRVTEGRANRRRDYSARIALERAIHDMDAAVTWEQIWAAATPMFEALELDFATLRQRAAEGCVPSVHTWTSPNNKLHYTPEQDIDSWLAHVRIHWRGHILGDLEIGKAVHDQPLFAATPELVERLRESIGRNVDRINRAQQRSTHEGQADAHATAPNDARQVSAT